MQEVTIGEIIGNARNRMGISQRELARKTNIDNTTIAKIEKDLRSKPDMLVLRKIAYELKIDEIELFRLSGYSEDDINIIVQKNILNLSDILSSLSSSDLEKIKSKLKTELKDREKTLESLKAVINFKNADGSINFDANNIIEKEKAKTSFIIDNIINIINLINEQLEQEENNNQNNSDVDLLIYNYLVFLNIKSIDI
ncbi:MAG: helix-turn-helix transcriptional regulator [bacterium]